MSIESAQGTAVLDAALNYQRHGLNVVACNGKQPIGSWARWQSARQTEADVRAMFEADHNVGVITGAVSGIVVFDVDTDGAADPWATFGDLAGCNPATPVSVTQKGIHIWFRHPGFTVPNGTRLNDSVIDVRGDGGLVIAPPSVHESGHVYQWDETLNLETADLAPIPDRLLDLLRSRSARSADPRPDSGWTAHLTREILEGQRNSALTAVAGGLIHRGLTVEETLAVLEVVNDARCRPRLEQGELGRIVVSIGRTEARRSYFAYPAFSASISDLAFHGLAGEVVRAYEPHTEAAPVAILVQLLTAIGNAIGPGPHVLIEDAEHPGRLFIALIGDTSTSRKGTSLSRVMSFMNRVDPDWRANVKTGLSSGEGLVYHVRDRQEKVDDDGQVVVVDAGVKDKRLLIVEPEIGSVLRVLRREGNTLSPVSRDAWDGGVLGSLGTLTRHSSLRATGAHISIIMHGTVEELRRYLKESEIFGGWANRVLWVTVSRDRLLPFGGRPDEKLIEGLAARVSRAITEARKITEVGFDAEAARRWCELYPDLSLGRPGLLGKVTDRSTAQVNRLALLYALLDQSRVIRLPHLEAGLALWSYCHQSAIKVFCAEAGDRVSPAILEALRLRGRLSRTQINELFSGHQKSEDIETALATLADAGLARKAVQQTAGRPAEIWYPAEKAEERNNDSEQTAPAGKQRARSPDLSADSRAQTT